MLIHENHIDMYYYKIIKPSYSNGTYYISIKKFYCKPWEDTILYLSKTGEWISYWNRSAVRYNSAREAIGMLKSVVKNLVKIERPIYENFNGHAYFTVKCTTK